MSGFFQGYAQMMSSVGWGWDDIWSQGSGKSKPWGRSFKVKWLQLHDLPFQKTLHLKNPWNDYKPVKISRDCQELPQDIGKALCELLDGGDDVDLNLKREEVRDDLSSKWLYKEQLHSFQDEDFNVPLVHMEPMLYPSSLYEHQAEAGRFHLEHLRTAGIYLPENPSIATGASKVKQSKYSRTNGSFASIKDGSPRFNGWGLSAERSPISSTLTEDDILEMTYEEYLEAHSRGNRRLDPPVRMLLSLCATQKREKKTRKLIVGNYTHTVADNIDDDRLPEHLEACRSLHLVKNILMIPLPNMYTQHDTSMKGPYALLDNFIFQAVRLHFKEKDSPSMARLIDFAKKLGLYSVAYNVL